MKYLFELIEKFLDDEKTLPMIKDEMCDRLAELYDKLHNKNYYHSFLEEYKTTNSKYLKEEFERNEKLFKKNYGEDFFKLNVWEK